MSFITEIDAIGILETFSLGCCLVVSFLIINKLPLIG